MNIPFELINRWGNSIVEPEFDNINLIYSLAYKRKVYLNKIHELMLKESYNKQNNIVLFHGSREGIKDSINFIHS